MDALISSQELSAIQEKALAALLTHRTIKAAAESAEIAESTMHRWLLDPTFKAAYAEARARMLAEAVTRLQQGATDAADVFINGLKLADDDARIKAARALFEFMYKGVELEDARHVPEILERLNAVEQQNANDHSG